MKKWEYKSIKRKVPDSELNELGLEGWELVCHTCVVEGGDLNQYYVFKRELDEHA